jgi:hypothetical protein
MTTETAKNLTINSCWNRVSKYVRSQIENAINQGKFGVIIHTHSDVLISHLNNDIKILEQLGYKCDLHISESSDIFDNYAICRISWK